MWECVLKHVTCLNKFVVVLATSSIHHLNVNELQNETDFMDVSRSKCGAVGLTDL